MSAGYYPDAMPNMINPQIKQPRVIIKGMLSKQQLTTRRNKDSPLYPLPRGDLEKTMFDLLKGDIVISKNERQQGLGAEDDPLLRDHVGIMATVNGMGQANRDMSMGFMSRKYREYHFSGIVTDDYEFTSVDKHGVEVQSSGTTEIVNNGPHDIDAGDLLYWAFPDPSKLSLGFDKRRQAQGGRQGLWVKPLKERNVAISSLKLVYEYIRIQVSPDAQNQFSQPGQQPVHFNDAKEFEEQHKTLWESIKSIGMLFLLSMI